MVNSGHDNGGDDEDEEGGPKEAEVVQNGATEGRHEGGRE